MALAMIQDGVFDYGRGEPHDIGDLASAQSDGLRRAVCWIKSNGGAGDLPRPEEVRDWLVDHAIACYALAEARRVTGDVQLEPDLGAAVCRLVESAERHSASVDMEVRLWMELVVQCQSVILGDVHTAGEGRRMMLRESIGAGRMEAFLSKVAVTSSGTVRDRAASLFLQELPRDAIVGEGLDDELMAQIAGDPMALFYAAATLYRRGGAGWRLAKDLIHSEVVRQWRLGLEYGGSWDPIGSFGERYGRSGATAINGLILQIYIGLSGLVMFTC